MAILTKGQTFTSTDTVTNVKLHNLVDNAAFVAGSSGTCASGGGLEVSGGQLQIANNGVTVAKLSAGAPSWDGSSNLTVNGTLTTGGAISTSGNLAVNGTTALTGDATLVGKIVQSGNTSDRTVRLQTGSNTPYVISFGWDDNTKELLVTVGSSEYKVALTQV
jgi:hypothetical protein